jgi:hypothetical protein
MNSRGIEHLIKGESHMSTTNPVLSDIVAPYLRSLIRLKPAKSLLPRSRFAAVGVLQLLLFISLSPNVQGGTINFSDGTFSNSNWTTTTWYEFGGLGSATVSIGQQASGGNPGAYRFYNYTALNGNETLIDIMQVLNSATYNPQTQGAIDSISFSIDYTISAWAWWSWVAPAVEQNGVFYAYWIGPNGRPGWRNNSWTNPSFEEQYPGFGPSPDFSTNGAPVTFGFLVQLGSYDGFDAGSFTYGIDNFSVEINSTAVPEPGICSLMALGIGYVFCLQRRMKHS